MQSLFSWLMTCWTFFSWGQAPPAHRQTQPTPAPQQVVTRSITPKPTPSPSASVAASSGAEIASDAVCPGQSDTAKTLAALTCLTNNARRYHGLKPVADNPVLLAAAAAKDQDMLRCGYGHTACGKTFDYEVKAKGYKGQCYGENIAMGQRTPHDVFVAWMNSPGHRANILNQQYRDFGVAELGSSEGPLWTMELGGC
jgi:uncharacterized protein YkwD